MRRRFNAIGGDKGKGSLDLISQVAEGTALPSGAAGDMFFLTTTSTLYVYTTTWVSVSGGGVPPPTNTGIPISAGDYLYITYA